MNLEHLILIGGVLHFFVLIASARVPGILDWRRELASLSPLTRRLVWVHGAFIVLVVVGFGAVSALNAPALVSATPLARSVCGLIAIFWAARLALQYVVLDASSCLTTPVLRLGYHGLTVIFAYFSGVFGWAAVAPPAGSGM